MRSVRGSVAGLADHLWAACPFAGLRELRHLHSVLPRQGESRLWAVRLQAGWTAVFLFVLVECGNRLLEGGRLWASRLSWWGHVVLLLVVFAGVPRTGGTTPAGRASRFVAGGVWLGWFYCR